MVLWLPPPLLAPLLLSAGVVLRGVVLLARVRPVREGTSSVSASYCHIDEYDHSDLQMRW